MKKKWAAGAWAAACLLAPQRALAQAELAPVRQVLLGAERVPAYWTLGLCSAAFVVLVCVWSVRLRRSARCAASRVKPRP